MHNWLSQSSDAKPALEVWGHPSTGEGSYRLKDLDDFINGRFTGRTSTSPSKSKRTHKKKSNITTNTSDSGKAGSSKSSR